MKVKLISFTLAHPRKTVFTLLFITAIIASGLRWVIIDDDMMKIIPDNLQSKKVWDEVSDEFGNVDLMVIAFGRRGESVINSESLAALWDLTSALDEIPEIDEVISLSNTIRIDSDDGFMEITDLQNNRTVNQSDIDEINSYIQKNPAVSERLLTSSTEFTSVIIKPQSNINYADMVNSIMPISKQILTDWEVHYSGIPYTTGLVPELIQKDVSSLMKFGMIIMVIILLANLRNITAVFFVLSVIFLSLVGMMGFMGWVVHYTGSPKFFFTLLNSSMPIVLLTIANSDGVHILTKFFRELRKHRDSRKAVYSAMDALLLPIFLTSLTTVAAFFTLIWTPLKPLTGYGLSIGFGIIWAWILSSTFLPALISLKKWDIHSKAIVSKSFLEKLIHWFGNHILKHPKFILGCGLLILFLGGWGISLLKVDVNYKNFFKPGTEIRDSMDFIDDEMSGSLNMVIRVEDEIKQPEVLLEMEKLQSFVESDSNITTSISIADVIKQMHRVVMDDDPKFETIPATREEVNNLFTMYSMSGDPDDFNSLVDYEFNVGIISAMMKSVSTDQIYDFVLRTEKYIAENVSDKIKPTITGMLVVFRDLVILIIKSSIINITTAILIIFIISWLFYKSPIWAGLSIIPLTFAVILNFGFMGIFGIELSHITAILSSIIIGVGVDFAIHYIAQFRKYSRNELGLNQISKEVLEDVGYPIILDAGSNMAFGALLISSFVPVQYIGGLMVFAMLSTSIGTLTLLAALTEINKKYLYTR